MEHTPLLEVKDLHLSIDSYLGEAKILDGVSFSLRAGRVTCLVGESGCGKSMTSLTIMGLQHPLPRSRHEALKTRGEIRFEQQDLLTLSENEMARLRGDQIAMIFQEPMTSLNPVLTIGDQLAEAVRTHHRDISEAEIEHRVLQTLEKVHISGAGRLDEYPFQLSGGMRQRVMIAMALINNPKLLIADEPTTALDVTVQAQILQLIKELQAREQAAILFITHDLGVVAEIADDVVVMYGGRVVESGPVAEVFYNPQHPYLIGLLNSIPRIGERCETLQTIAGRVPSATDMPIGCRFRTRCPFAISKCEQVPPAVTHQGDHVSYCWVTPLEQHFSLSQTDKQELLHVR